MSDDHEKASSFRVLMLAKPGDERTELEEAARAEGLSLRLVDDAGEALIALREGDPDALLLPLEEQAEESLLLTRVLKRRPGAPPVVLVQRSASGVATQDEARELGAELLVTDPSIAAWFAAIGEILDLPVVTIEPELELEPEQEDEDEQAIVPSVEAGVLTGSSKPANVRRKLDQARHADYFVILGVERGATVEEIGSAHTALCLYFAPDTASSASQRRDLEEISDALLDACYVLGNETLRQLYLSGLGRG